MGTIANLRVVLSAATSGFSSAVKTSAKQLENLKSSSKSASESATAFRASLDRAKRSATGTHFRDQGRHLAAMNKGAVVAAKLQDAIAKKTRDAATTTGAAFRTMVDKSRDSGAAARHLMDGIKDGFEDTREVMDRGAGNGAIREQAHQLEKVKGAAQRAASAHEMLAAKQVVGAQAATVAMGQTRKLGAQFVEADVRARGFGMSILNTLGASAQMTLRKLTGRGTFQQQSARMWFDSAAKGAFGFNRRLVDVTKATPHLSQLKTAIRQLAQQVVLPAMQAISFELKKLVDNPFAQQLSKNLDSVASRVGRFSSVWHQHIGRIRQSIANPLYLRVPLTAEGKDKRGRNFLKVDNLFASKRQHANAKNIQAEAEAQAKAAQKSAQQIANFGATVMAFAGKVGGFWRGSAKQAQAATDAAKAAVITPPTPVAITTKTDKAGRTRYYADGKAISKETAEKIRAAQATTTLATAEIASAVASAQATVATIASTAAAAQSASVLSRLTNFLLHTNEGFWLVVGGATAGQAAFGLVASTAWTVGGAIVNLVSAIGPANIGIAALASGAAYLSVVAGKKLWSGIKSAAEAVRVFSTWLGSQLVPSRMAANAWALLSSITNSLSQSMIGLAFRGLVNVWTFLRSLTIANVATAAFKTLTNAARAVTSGLASMASALVITPIATAAAAAIYVVRISLIGLGRSTYYAVRGVFTLSARLAGLAARGVVGTLGGLIAKVRQLGANAMETSVRVMTLNAAGKGLASLGARGGAAMDVMGNSFSGVADKMSKFKMAMMAALPPVLAQFVMFGPITGAALAAIGGVAEGIKTASSLQASEVVFSKLYQDADKGKQAIADLSSFMSRAPFEMDNLLEQSQKLAKGGVGQSDLVPTLRVLGDLAAGTGQSLDTMTDLYARGMETGVARTDDLMQYVRAGVPVFDLLAKQTGKTRDEIRAMADAGGVGFGDLQKALLDATSKTGQFGGAAVQQTRTMAGAWTNIKTNIGLTMSDIGKHIIDAFDLEKVAANLSAFSTTLSATITPAVSGIITWVAEKVRSGLSVVWGFVQSNWDGIVSITSQAMATIGSLINSGIAIFTTAWTAIGSAAATAFNYIDDIAGQVMGVRLSELFTNFADFATKTLLTLEFAFLHWAQVGDFAATYASSSGVTAFLDMQHFIMATIPELFSWIYNNWDALIADITNAASTFFGNIITNASTAFGMIVSYLTEKAAWAYLWLEQNWHALIVKIYMFLGDMLNRVIDAVVSAFTGIFNYIASGGQSAINRGFVAPMKGFTSELARTKGPQFSSRAATELEKTLDVQTSLKGRQLGADFADFMAKRMAEKAAMSPAGGLVITPPVVPEIANPTLFDPAKGPAPLALSDGANTAGGGDRRESLAAVLLGSKEAVAIEARSASDNRNESNTKSLLKETQKQSNTLAKIASNTAQAASNSKPLVPATF